MRGITAIGIALLAAVCLAAGPAPAKEKKGDRKSFSKSRSSKKKSFSKKSKSSTKKSLSTSKSSTEEGFSTSKSSTKLDRKGLEPQRKPQDLRDMTSRKDPSRQGNLGSSAGSSSDREGLASRMRKSRTGGGGASGPSVEVPGGKPPKATSRAIDSGAPGSVANPVGDPLAKTKAVGSAAPTARELQDQSRAAKGDRTSQSSTIFRVKDGSRMVHSTETASGEKRFDETPQEAKEREAKEKEEAERDREEGRYRPSDNPVSENPTPMTDEEIARYQAETKAGLVNPTGVTGGGAAVDPNRAREFGRTASPRVGQAINPGTGEAGGSAPSPDGAPSRPDECDLAGGAGAGCGSGDGGLGQ